MWNAFSGVDPQWTPGVLSLTIIWAGSNNTLPHYFSFLLYSVFITWDFFILNPFITGKNLDWVQR